MPHVSRCLWYQRRRSLLPVFAHRDMQLLPRAPGPPPFLAHLRHRRVRQGSRDSRVGPPAPGAEEPFDGRPRDTLAGLRRHTIAAMGGGEAKDESWVPIVTVSGNLGETSSWSVAAAPKSSVRSRSTSRVADQEAARAPIAAVAYSSQDAEPLRSSTGFTQLLLHSSKLELSDSYTRLLLHSSQLSNSGQTAATASDTCKSGAIQESEALTGSALLNAMRELRDAGGPDNVVLKIVRQSLHTNADVRRGLQRLWRVIVKGASQMEQLEYMDFHLCLYRWLMHTHSASSMQLEEESDAWAIAIGDWKNDLQDNLSYLRFDDFFDAMTELAVLRQVEDHEGNREQRGVPEVVLECVTFLKRLSSSVTARLKSGRMALRHKWPRQPHAATVTVALCALSRHASTQKGRSALFKSWNKSGTGVLSLAELGRGLDDLSQVLHELHPCAGRHATSACIALMRRLASNEMGQLDLLTQQLFERALQRHREPVRGLILPSINPMAKRKSSQRSLSRLAHLATRQE